MNTITTPEPPDEGDGNSKKNSPTHPGKDKRDQSANAQKKVNDNTTQSQDGPDQSELFLFHSKTNESSPGDSVGDPDDTIYAETLSPRSILNLRLPASELEGVETKRVRTKITVGKPPKDQFFRVKDGAEYWVAFGLIEMERSSSFYLVAPGPVRDWMIEEGVKSFSDCVLCLAVTRHGEPRVWPLKQSTNPWHETARNVAEMAKTGWTKLIPDQSAGYYVSGTATNQAKEPVWPAESFEEILEKAFAGRIIDSLNHDVVKELRGDD